MIQSIITRIAQNSFLIKGWSVTFAAGLLGLSRPATLGGRYPVYAWILNDGYNGNPS